MFSQPINQPKISIKPLKLFKPLFLKKNNTRPHLNEIPAHFTYAIKRKGCGVISGLYSRAKKTDNSTPAGSTASE